MARLRLHMIPIVLALFFEYRTRFWMGKHPHYVFILDVESLAIDERLSAWFIVAFMLHASIGATNILREYH